MKLNKQWRKDLKKHSTWHKQRNGQNFLSHRRMEAFCKSLNMLLLVNLCMKYIHQNWVSYIIQQSLDKLWKKAQVETLNQANSEPETTSELKHPLEITINYDGFWQKKRFHFKICSRLLCWNGHWSSCWL